MPHQHKTLLKYLISGTTAAFTNFGLYFIFTRILNWYYLTAYVASVFGAFWVSFILQKFWTFNNKDTDQINRQIGLYVLVNIGSLIVTTAGMYIFVSLLHLWDALALVVTSLGIAFCTFFINKLFVFKAEHHGGKETIVLAVPNYPPEPGGVATHAQKYREEFEKAGHLVHLVVASHMPKLPPPLNHIIFAFTVFLEAVGADMIYVMDTVSSGPAAYVAWLLRKPYVIRIGGDVVWERAAEKGKTTKSCLEFYKTEKYQAFRFYSITKFVLTHAEKVIVPCDLLKTLYVTYYSVPSEKIILVPNPLPTHPTPNPSPKGRVEKSVVFASRLVSYKNLELVTKAFATIDATFYILGDGPEKQKLEARRSELGDRVKILGTVSRSEKDEYLKKCMLTVAPALTEFNPNYVLEGFTFCKPTLMSRENGLPFTLPEIMLFDPRNEKEFTEKLTYLLSDAGYAEAQNWVKNLRFAQTWDDVIKKNLEIIKGICEA